MPGPLSWFFHYLPDPLHRAGALASHIAQLIVPFAPFAPQPAASVAAAVVIATQLWLVLSGNFDPFPGAPPVFVRARLYRYRFTNRRERRATGAWWHRSPIRDYVPPVTRRRQDRVT